MSKKGEAQITMFYVCAGCGQPYEPDVSLADNPGEWMVGIMNGEVPSRCCHKKAVTNTAYDRRKKARRKGKK